MGGQDGICIVLPAQSSLNAGVVASITSEIAKVNDAGAQMGAVSRETLASAQRLAGLAAELQSLVGRFRLE